MFTGQYKGRAVNAFGTTFWTTFASPLPLDFSCLPFGWRITFTILQIVVIDEVYGLSSEWNMGGGGNTGFSS